MKRNRFKEVVVFIYAILFSVFVINAQNSQKSTKAITSLSDYSFIGTGYGALTEPSMPAAGVQKPYVPDLTNLDNLTLVNVSDGNALSNALSGSNKVIVAANGTYYIKGKTWNNINNIHVIAKNKGGATIKLSGDGQNFELNNSGVEVHNLSIIGFKAEGNGLDPFSGHNYFIFGSGNSSSYNADHVYLSDMEWYNYAVTIYSGLQSHDWTIDKSLYYNSTGSYLWYMMGWHQSVINTVMYDGQYLSFAIRGCYPPNETYVYNQSGQPQIVDRDGHFLADNDWTHLVVNNTFGSNYKYDRNNDSHMAVWYDTPGDESGKTEDVYFPPKNIVIANNAFIDNGNVDKYPIKFAASRGINEPNNPAAVNGVTIKNNYTDKGIIASPYESTDLSSIDFSTNVKNFSNFGFDDGNRDYTITITSGLLNKGATDVYIPNVDNVGNLRVGVVDVGAFEAPNQTTELTANFVVTLPLDNCSGLVAFADRSTGVPTSWLWNFGDGSTSTEQNPTHIYATGDYNIKLTVSDGSDTDDDLKSISVTSEVPVVTDAERCGNGSVILKASGDGTINWYDAITGGNLLYTGTDFQTPEIFKTTKYYVENVTGEGNKTYVGGPDNKLSATGAYFQYASDHGLIFDVTQDVILKKAKVFAEGTKNRTIQLQNSSGTVLQEKTINISDGESTVILDLQIPVGVGYKLIVLAPTNDDPALWRDDANAVYPYEIGGGIVNITGSTASDAGFYYYFYNWEIETGTGGCTSSRVEAIATVNEAIIPDFTFQIDEKKVTFTNKSVNSDSYLWNFGDKNLSMDENPIHVYNEAGTYNIELIAKNSECEDVKVTKQVSIITTDITTDNSFVKIYPNPADNNITFKINNLNHKYFISIYDSKGLKVVEQEINSVNMVIDISLFEDGVYFYNITTKNKSKVGKIFIQH